MVSQLLRIVYSCPRVLPRRARRRIGIARTHPVRTVLFVITFGTTIVPVEYSTQHSTARELVFRRRSAVCDCRMELGWGLACGVAKIQTERSPLFSWAKFKVLSPLLVFIPALATDNNATAQQRQQ